MSSEIRIVFQEVEQALSELNASSQSLDPSFPLNSREKNVLDTVKKLKECQQLLQQSMLAYKQLLLKNEQATRTAIQTMREADRDILQKTGAREVF
ncbi:YwqI/YxiC family protein [Numidum massiliense]|uniref:YwqI/YxiC family protein n=1 Tax=Numidum massiliense TaxID=1522315 RepID=UPI0006D56BC3|nr:YwqI/YxiC family protein [Numidum massiliense]